MSPFASLFKKKRTSNAKLEMAATGEDWVAREAVRHEQILLNDLQAGRIMCPGHGVLHPDTSYSGFGRVIFNLTAQKGEREKEQRMLKYGARLLQETIAACDGNNYYPIKIFSENEIREAIHGVHHLNYGSFSRTYEDRPIFMKCYSNYKATYEDRPIFMKCYSNYMATCQDGRVFIKCDSESDDMLFNEITTVVQLNHRNVVKLLGCCFEMDFQILIFELLPNNLANLLCQSQGPIAKANSQGPLAWENRLRMAIEIADAVTYLHIAKPRPIIHRDINSYRILLDEHCRPKLCGFELSIAIPLGETHVEANAFKCRGGDKACPHYLNTGIVTEKVDVYSFGWLLLELLSGRRPYEITKTGEELTTELVLEKVKSLTLIFYANLPKDTRKIEQWMACIELAGRCIDQVPDQRPAMKEVALQLRQLEKHQIPCSSCLASSSSS